MIINRIPNRLNARQKRIAELVRLHLERSFAANISLCEIASLFEISIRCLRDLFKKEFGCPPSHYVAMLRVNRARQLLASQMPIKLVAAESGFFDQSHLNRHFKRIAGQTPAQYVAELQKLRSK